jgi:hypothetical protein
MLTVLLATLAGMGLHARTAAAQTTAPPRVSAWLALDSVRLDGEPLADLHLVVTSHDEATVYLTSLTLDGGGTGTLHEDLWRPLTPGLVEDLRVPAILHCGPGTRPAPLRLALTVTRDPALSGADRPGDPSGSPPAGGSGPATTASAGSVVTLTAIRSGVLQVPGGLCQAASQQLPQAYLSEVTARLITPGAGTASGTGTATGTGSSTGIALAVSGLPAEATEVFAAQADGWLLPLTSPAAIRAGSTTLTLGPPQPRCEDAGTRRVLPTGLQLLLATGDGSGIHEAYAPVGTALARWLLRARQRLFP